MNTSPYPGLRPFEREESHLFFGREIQTGQLLEKLAATRFIAVIGPSGCGKSSLIRAGMIDALETGFLSSAGPYWRIARMRPGDQPLRNLAEALVKDGLLAETQDADSTGAEPPGKLDLVPFVLAALSRGPMGLGELFRENKPPERTNLFILVDQFEELFRYRRQEECDESAAFVNLLLTGAAQLETPVYVVITMRSDFIGDCARFHGLPEALNAGQFLTPRLTREQQQMAIVGPARVFGGDVEPALVARLLNEMGDDPDQLPLMQHCLRQMWLQAGANAATPQEAADFAFFEASPAAGVVMTIAEYEHVGGLENALSNHADEAFKSLSLESHKQRSVDENVLSPKQRIAEYLFRCLSERSPDQHDTRRPVKLREVAAVAGVPAPEVREVVEVFRDPERCFLTPAAGKPLEPETVLDISHESLIRQWERMNRWVVQEAKSAEIYRRLEQTASLWKQERAALWGTPDLEAAQTWWAQEHPTADWARRYSANFDRAADNFNLARDFLEASTQAQEEKRRQEEQRRQEDIDLKLAQQRQEEHERQRELELNLAQQRQRVFKTVTLALVVVLLVAFVSLGWVLNAKKSAEKAKESAEKAKDIARSGQIAAQSQMQRSNPQRSLLLGVEALNMMLLKNEPRVPSAEEALRQALANSSGLGVSCSEGRITISAISPDSRWLVTGGDDGTVRLWDLTAANPTAAPTILSGHRTEISALAMSADAKWLATGSRDWSVRLWDVTAKTLKKTIPLNSGELIADMAFSPDHHWLITNIITAEKDNLPSNEQLIRLWDVTAENPAETSSILHTYKKYGAEKGQPLFLISPDRRWLAAGNQDDEDVFLWDLKNIGKPSVLSGHERGVSTLAFSSDSQWLLAGSNVGMVRLWEVNAPDARPQSFQEQLWPIRIAARSVHHPWLVTIGYNGEIRLRNVAAGDLKTDVIVLQKAQEENVWYPLSPDKAQEANVGYVLSPDGDWLARSFENTVRLWNLRAKNPFLQPIDLHLQVEAVAVNFSQDSRWLNISGKKGSLQVCDLKAEKPAATLTLLRGNDAAIWTTAISPDSRWLMTNTVDGNVRLWDLRTITSAAVPTILRTTTLAAITATAFSCDNSRLATVTEDNLVWLWDLGTKSPATIISGHGKTISAVAISTDNQWLVTAYQDGSFRRWNLSAKNPENKVTPILSSPSQEAITAIAISPDNRWLITESVNGVAQVWDLTAPHPTGVPKILRGSQDLILTITISPNSQWAATGSQDSVGLWKLNAENPETFDFNVLFEQKGMGAVTAIAISPDNRWLAAGSFDNNVRLWDLNLVVNQPTTPPIVLRGHEGPVWAVAIAPDGRWLATGSEDATIRLWDLTAANPALTPPAILRGHQARVRALAFSSDSHWLSSGSLDGTARLWNLRLKELIDLACQTAGRNLSNTEWNQYFPEKAYHKTCPELPEHYSIVQEGKL